MSWHSPELLWLLLLVPICAAIAWLAARRRQKATLAVGQEQTVRPLIVGRAQPWRLTKTILWLVALSGVIVALAGPQYGSRTQLLHRRGIDVVIALDFSKSMLARDVAPNRIDRAKAELGRLLELMQGHRIGLVAFAGDTIAFPMTIDHSAVRLFLRDLGPYDMPFGGTAIGRALIASKRLLQSARPDNDQDTAERPTQVVLLFTDGEDHEGEPLEAAAELAAAGIAVYTVGIGSPSGEPIPTYAQDGTWTGYAKDKDGNVVTSSLTAQNEKVLQQIAKDTGGKYFRARRGTIGIAQIEAEMAKLKQTEKKSRRVTVHENRFALVLLPAFLLLVLQGILPTAWLTLRRSP